MGELVYLAADRFGSNHGTGAAARLVVGVPLGVVLYVVLLALTKPRSRPTAGRLTAPRGRWLRVG
jgi:hypothetical protein